MQKYQLEGTFYCLFAEFYSGNGLCSLSSCDYIIRGADKDKCDKLIVAANGDSEMVSVFVELKGIDVAHAVKQLEATLSYPLFAQNRTKWTKARVVANKIPANTGRSVVERAKVDFRKKYNCELLCLKSGNPDILRQDKLNK